MALLLAFVLDLPPQLNGMHLKFDLTDILKIQQKTIGVSRSSGLRQLILQQLREIGFCSIDQAV